jgi:DUF4097 and DUF4098 domain-containing protein YvlB
MKKTVITLSILILISSMLSAMFFFSSGFFNTDVGYVTVKNGNQILNELNSLPFIYVNEPTEIIEINELKTVSVEGIEDIEIDSVSTKIIIEPTDSENASFHLVGTGQGHKLFIRESNDEINVEVKYPKGFNLFLVSDLTLYVKIPEKYSRSLYVDSISGNIEIEDLNLNLCDIETTSGEVDIANTYCENADIDTISGDVLQLNGYLPSVESVSGRLKFEEVSIIQNTRINTISGDVTIIPTEDSSFEVDFDSVSGNLEGKSILESGRFNLDVETVSGDLTIN